MRPFGVSFFVRAPTVVGAGFSAMGRSTNKIAENLCILPIDILSRKCYNNNVRRGRQLA